MAEFLEEEDLGGGLRVLRLNRPPASALNTPFLLSIEQRLSELAVHPEVKALILTGTGRVLSAGLDLKEAVGFDEAAQSAVVDGLNRAYVTQGLKMMSRRRNIGIATLSDTARLSRTPTARRRRSRRTAAAGPSPPPAASWPRTPSRRSPRPRRVTTS